MNRNITKIVIVLTAIVLGALCVGSAFGLYYANTNKNVGITPPTSITYTFSFDIDWIANDNVTVCAWVWYDGVDGHWEAMQRVGNTNTYTAQLSPIYTYCIIGRRPENSPSGTDQIVFDAFNETTTLNLATTTSYVFEHLTMN